MPQFLTTVRSLDVIYWVRDDRPAYTSKEGSATLVADNVDALCGVVHAYVQAY